MYHSIGSQSNGEIGAELYCVSVENFRRQMEYISRTSKLGTGPFGDSPLITFDDGDISDYRYAYPILKELGLKGYFFILVSKVGTTGYMGWQQIRKLKDAGMVIGSHGMSHRILTELEDKELTYELSESKKILEKNLEQTVDYFSIPRGFHSKKVINKAKEAGYKAVFTSNPKDTDEFKVGRIPVKGNWNLEHFITIVNNGLSFKDKTEELLKNSTKKILGTKNYDRLRTRILKK